jgi:hypothetical protein
VTVSRRTGKVIWIGTLVAGIALLPGMPFWQEVTVVSLLTVSGIFAAWTHQ